MENNLRARPQRRRQALLSFMSLVFGTFFALSATAQQTSVPPAPNLTPLELAKSIHNPFEDFIVVPLEATTGFSVGHHHNAAETLNLQPLIPFRLSADWDFIARPSWSLTYLPSPHEQFGLQDLQASFYLTPRGANEWIWGIGPIFQFPTATTTKLGTGGWSAGPTAALVYSKGPWFNGILAYQLMSFAGDRDRGSVNQTDLEPQVSYNFESGWFVDCNPPITFDWTASAANGWTVPMGADAGKGIQNRPPIDEPSGWLL